MQWKRLTMIAAAVMLVGAGCTGATAPADEQGDAMEEKSPITVGVMVPLSGGSASYGTAVKRGVELAVGQQGSNVELIFEDSKCESEGAGTAATKLTSVDNVDAIIGGICSSATKAAAGIVADARVPMISPALTASDISDLGPFIFRTIPSDTSQAVFGANLVKEKGFESLAIIYTDEDYGIGFNGVLEQVGPGIGLNIVGSEAIDLGALDARAQLAKLTAAGPDSLYIISSSPETSVAILKQAGERDLHKALQIFGSEGLKSREVIFGAGPVAEGMILTSVSAGSEEFAAAYREKYGDEPGPFAAQAYDAMTAILTASQAEGELVDALRAVEIDGVSGVISFDTNGDLIGRNYEVYRVEAGAFTQE